MEKSHQIRLWILPLLLVVVLGGVVVVRNRQLPETVSTPTTERKTELMSNEVVELEIDTGEDTLLRFEVLWEKGMTVRDAVAQVAKGDLTLVVQRDEEAAFLMELAGLANEGRGGRNWVFEVNGKWADRSFAVYELEPGDHVLWKFVESE